MAPAFERILEQAIAGSIPVPPTARLVLTEGNYLLSGDAPWAAVAAELDECWYCDVPDRVRIARLVRRHEQFGKSPLDARAWVATVDEANTALITRARARAHLVVTPSPAAGRDRIDPGG